jgi:hypothetical protein
LRDFSAGLGIFGGHWGDRISSIAILDRCTFQGWEMRDARGAWGRGPVANTDTGPMAGVWRAQRHTQGRAVQCHRHQSAALQVGVGARSSWAPAVGQLHGTVRDSDVTFLRRRALRLRRRHQRAHTATNPACVARDRVEPRRRQR